MAGLGRGRKITQAKKAPEAIEKAALLLEEKGWCTGTTRRTIERPDGTKIDAYCMGGALLQVARADAWDRAWVALGEEAAEEGYFSASDYNDSQTDKRKVIRFMRRVARQMRGTK
jgi:hypothetical protein